MNQRKRRHVWGARNEHELGSNRCTSREGMNERKKRQTVRYVLNVTRTKDRRRDRILSMLMRAAGLAAVVVLGGCGTDDPPTLPGASDPSCHLAAAHHFLVSRLTTKDPDPVDLSVPPDGRPDNLEYPDTYIEAGVGMALTDALGRALASERVAWVISTQSCDDHPEYVRVALRRALGITQDTPLNVVTLAADVPIWSVGIDANGAVTASDGIGVVPVAASIDLAADTTEPVWVQFYSVVVHATLSTNGLSGTIAGAIDTAEAAPAVADGIARTLTIAHESDVSCPPTCQHPAMAELIHLLDTNGDLVFSRDEILASGGLSALGYFPDLDLLASDHGETVFWPNHDHDAESLGHGYVFDAVEVDAR